MADFLLIFFLLFMEKLFKLARHLRDNGLLVEAFEVSSLLSKLASGERFAAIAPTQDQFCTSTNSSFAWISPDGILHLLGGVTHEAWADNWVQRETGQRWSSPQVYLLNKGWIAVTSSRYIAIGTWEVASGRAWDTFFELLYSCPNLDWDGHVISVSFTDSFRSQKMNLKELERATRNMKRASIKGDRTGRRRRFGGFLSLASELKRMEFPEKEESLDDLIPYEPGHLDRWMRSVAVDLAGKLGLHYPAFLGAGLRRRWGGGAFAFSASNDEGKSVVMKITPYNELGKYQKIKDFFGEDPPSIIPRIYSVHSFSDLGYEAPRGQLEPYGVVVTEELMEAPSGLGELLQKKVHDSDSLRILQSNKEVLRDLASRVVRTCSAQILEELRKMGLDSSRLDDIWTKISGDLSLGIADMISQLKWDHPMLGELKEKWIRRAVSGPLDKSLLGIPETKKINEENPKLLYSFRDPVISALEEALTFEVNASPAGYHPEEDRDEDFNAAEYNLNIPGLKQFSNSIKELKELGINPRDVHKGNIMIRPDTGELVVFDVGGFDLGLL